MYTSKAVASQSNDSSSFSSDSLSSAGLPLADMPSDVEEAVEQLAQRPKDELHQARKHHRRALKALRDGAYDALSDETRERLTHQFRLNLRALNQALDDTGALEGDDGSAPPPSSSSLQDVLTGLL